MGLTKKHRGGILLMLLALVVATGCTVSYKLTGASIDYTKVKTISLETFQNRAAYQWGPMAQMFNQALNDAFVQQTKLVQVRTGGDLHFAGEITSYDQFNKSISSDGYSSMVQLKMT
ncbi:MAG: LptE family protein, partial [Bacteroidaceae bacterium]|nr:LptE family protein [Bacteroidaceae bacterium]